MELLVYSGFWLAKTNSPASLSFFLRLSHSLAVFCSFVVTYHPCRHTPPHSINSLSPPHTDSTLYILPPSLSLSSLSSPCHRGEIKKNLPASVVLFISVLTLHSPLSHCCGASSRMHARRHARKHAPSLWGDGQTVPRCGLLYGWPDLSLLLLTRRHAVNLPFWSTEKGPA